jgi:hypothetical protein
METRPTSEARAPSTSTGVPAGRVLRRLPDAAVPHRFTALDGAQREDPRFERHHGDEPEIGPALAGKGADAIERYSGADPIAAGLGPAEDPGGVGDTRGVLETVCERAKPLELFAGHRAIRFIRARQMRQQTNLSRRFAKRADARECARKPLRPKSQPVHAGVGLDPDDRGRDPGLTFEQIDLAGFVNYELELVARRLFQIVRIADPLEKQDGLTQPRVAKRNALFKSCDRKAVGIR